MVQFGTGFYTPMDREYGTSSLADTSTNDAGLSIGDIGMSMALGPVPNVQQVASKLRAGVKTVELGFMGQGKGSGQGHTPGMYGKKQRQALSEMQRANKVDFTTHATVGVYGVAGMTQQGGFSKESRKFSIDEIKRAVEFAADVAEGGPVVVHTGEFPRPMVDAEWNEKDPKWKGKFQAYDEEGGRTSYKVVDTRTGGLLHEARKNMKVNRAKWKRYQEGDEYWEEHKGNNYTDENGKLVTKEDYIDFFGNRIDPAHRVPVFDKKENRFVTEAVGWEGLKKDAKEMTERAKKFWREHKDNGKDDWEKSMWLRFKDVKSEDEIRIRPEEAFVIATFETQAANARGYALYYSGDVEGTIKSIKKLRKARELYKKIEEEADPEEKWKLKQTLGSEMGGLIPPESEYPSELIEKQLRRQEQQLKHFQESSASQWAQAEEQMERIRHVESAETYALTESFDSYAQAGVSAMMHSDKLEKQGKLKKPIAVAMENLFPESFGAHPDELIKLIEGSRDRMKELLVQRGMSENKAKKEAEEHLTTTLDVGHMNMWRKYWKSDPNKSIEQNDSEFNKWMLDKIGEMARKKIVGHLHIVDNYGYQDDHLAPGEGNTPIKEAVEVLKKNGFKGDIIVEPGADYTTDTSGFQSVIKTWELFGSPVYGAGGPGPADQRNWNQIGNGYVGQNQPPYFVFGAYSPTEEWHPWSGVPLD